MLFLHDDLHDGINIALPIEVRAEPKISINAFLPNSIFPNAEFPFEVEITGIGTSLKNAEIQIIPPKEIMFRGETKHSFSLIDKDIPIKINARLLTIQQEDIVIEHQIPFQIIVIYENDAGEIKTESKTVSVGLRPRSHFEFVSDGGLWIGDFFLAPTVSIGSIIMAPVGIILGILYKKYRKNHKLKQT